MALLAGYTKRNYSEKAGVYAKGGRIVPNIFDVNFVYLVQKLKLKCLKTHTNIQEMKCTRFACGWSPGKVMVPRLLDRGRLCSLHVDVMFGGRLEEIYIG